MGELLVPHVQSGQVGRRAPPGGRLRGLHERGPLAGHPLEIRFDARHDWAALDDQVVHERAAGGGLPAHEREILRREDHGLDQTEYLAGAHLRAVDAGAVGLAAHDLELDDLLAPFRLHQPHADHGSSRCGRGRIRGDPHQGRLGPDAV